MKALFLQKAWLKILVSTLLAGLLGSFQIGLVLAQTTPETPPALTSTLAPVPAIQAILNQIDVDSVRTYDGDLSGEWPVNIGGNPFQFTNRYSRNSVSIEKATQYAFERFTGFGLDVRYQEYLSSGTPLRNVVAEQPGQVHPEQIFLIVAHLDSITPSNFIYPDAPAPGADDNASGSSGVLLAAELLSQHDFDYTLRYILFTGEEIGLLGSYAYASQSALNQEDILGVLNLDMIAYNSDDLPVVDLHTRSGVPGDIAIANLFVEAVSAYGLNLMPEVFNDGMRRSDHASFWDNGYPAILAIEDEADFTPYYHTENDTLSSLDLDYFAEFVRASLASLAHMGGLLGYADGVVRDAATGQPLADAFLSVQYDASRLLSTTSQAGGDFSLPLPPGSFTLNATAPNHVPLAVPEVDIAAGQATTLDIALGTCQQLSGVDFSYTPAAPYVGQTVALTASLTTAVPTPVVYTWDFGDGSQTISGLELTNVSHVFDPHPRDQTYQVTVSAFNNCYIPVESTRPVMVFAYKQYLPLAGRSINSTSMPSR